MSNRHRREDEEDNEESSDLKEAKIFLKTLEKEMYPRTLAKYEANYESGEKEGELDELYKIWHKYKQIVKKTGPEDASTSKINIIQHIIIPPEDPENNSTTIEIIGDLTQEEIAEGLKEFENRSFVDFSEHQENEEAVKDEEVVGNETQESVTSEGVLIVEKENQTEAVKLDEAVPALNQGEVKINKVQEVSQMKQPTSPLEDKTNTLMTDKCKVNMKLSSLDEVWGKHLHYPKIEKGTKRIKEKVPLAIVSKKWKQYHEFKNNEKDMKEQAKQKRKAEREMKKEQSAKEDNNKIKRCYVKKKADGDAGIAN